MSLPQRCILTLTDVERFFDTSTKELAEENSGFVPVEGMMTAAQQVAHAAHTIDWFIEGGFRPEGFDMDFEGHAKIVAGVTSLAAAKEWFHKAIAAAKAKIETTTEEDLMKSLPAGPIMGGAPVVSIIGAISDHTAHHRGSLAVYTRLCGKVPPMPYM